MCTICDIRQRHFVVASKYSYIIRIFEYFRNRILESYFLERMPALIITRYDTIRTYMNAQRAGET